MLQHIDTPGHPGSYSGLKNLTKVYPDISRSELHDQLKSVDFRTKHYDWRAPRKHIPIYVRRRRQLFQADLIDIKELAPWNSRTKYLLCVIDTFSRFLWVRPTPNKTAARIASLFEDILNAAGPQAVTRLLTDRGTEFTGAPFQSMLRRQRIEHSFPNFKCAHVERVQRTLQNILYMYMTSRETKKYVDQLPSLVESYNLRWHSSIRMTPTEAENPANGERVNHELSKFYIKSESKYSRTPKFKVGDLARLAMPREVFNRGYQQTTSDAIYRISDIYTHLPRFQYKIETFEGVPMRGTWYEGQLIAVEDHPDLFKISRVHGRRVRNNIPQLEVSFVGNEGRFFINEEEVTDTVFPGQQD